MLRSFLIAVLCLVISSPAFAQSAASQRKAELESVSISEIPLEGYLARRPGDAEPITRAAYTYQARIYSVRDADTVKAQIDVGFNFAHTVAIRFFGIDTFELTRSGGKTQSHVDRGYKCRDLMLRLIKSKEVLPRKSTYHVLDDPIDVVVQTVKSGKYAGRYLMIVHKDGLNVNQALARAGCGIVTTYDTKTPYMDRNTPITPDLQ